MTKNNSFINFIDQIEDNTEFLNSIIQFLSIATLSNCFEENDSSYELYNDLNLCINRRLKNMIGEKRLENELNQILLLLENYQNIDKKYEIKSDFYEKSCTFYENYFKHVCKEKILLSENQQNVFLSIKENENNEQYAMPTSFGKSLIIKLISLYRAYERKRTIICVPTTALLNEYRFDLDKMCNDNVLISSNPNIEAMIYVTTQERLLNFNFRENDLFIVDEAYELINKDLRSAILNSIINKILRNVKISIKLFYPNITSSKITSNTSLENWEKKCLSQTFCSRNEETYNFDINKEILRITKQSRAHGEKIAIYSYLQNHIKISQMIFLFLDSIEISEIVQSNWFIFLEKVFSDNYLPIFFLKKGILINNGRIPKIFRYVTEKAFKFYDCIDIVICNNTLSKGVNLGIKNLIINAKNGIGSKASIDKFEIKNLLGRVGRNTTNILDRVGNVFYCLSDKQNTNKLKEINKETKVEYTTNNVDKSFENNLKDIKDGEVQIWKFLLSNFQAKIDFYSFLDNNIETLKNFYFNEHKNQDIYTEFYDFIINLYGGKKQFVQKIFKNKYQNIDSKLENEEFINYYINIRSKKYIFPIIFENYEPNKKAISQIKWYKDNDYYFKERTFTKEQKKGSILIKNIRDGDSEYKKMFTKILDDIFYYKNVFYDGSFQLLEIIILEYLEEKTNLKYRHDNDINKLLDKYNLPNEFKSILKVNKIESINDYEKSEIFEILNNLDKTKK